MTDCHSYKLLEARDAGIAPLWDSIYRTEFWDIVHADPTSMLGWMVLVTRRHMPSIDELTEEEALELGKYIRQVSIILKELTDCQKTYVIQFAESPLHPHVHFHIVPRAYDLPKEERSKNIFKHLNVPDDARLSDDVMNAFGAKVRARLLEMNG